MHEFTVNTTKKCQLIDITRTLNKIITQDEVNSGIMLVYVPHTTAGVTINENGDPDVKRDVLLQLDEISPDNPKFQHFEGNSDAHVKSSLVGCSEQVIIENGKLKLGTWQSVYFAEFDGPRHRKVWVKIIKD